jgi:hypothetical protein
VEETIHTGPLAQGLNQLVMLVENAWNALA